MTLASVNVRMNGGPGRLISQEEARRQARSHGWHQKVEAHITRRAGEILVLEHAREYTEAGVQVPAGGAGEREACTPPSYARSTKKPASQRRIRSTSNREKGRWKHRRASATISG